MQGNCPQALDYRNITETSAWQLTGITHSMYQQMDESSLSPWSKCTGFNFEMLTYDWMHSVYLGTARDLVASGILSKSRINIFVFFQCSVCKATCRYSKSFSVVLFNPGIYVLIANGRFGDVTNDMDEMLSRVHCSMRRTCKAHKNL